MMAELQKPTVVHVIGSLDRGGAEMMLFRLLRSSASGRFRHAVISLMDSGSLSEPIQALDIPVYKLGIPGGRIRPSHVLRLAKTLSWVNADVVHTWMYHSNLIGGLVSRLRSSTPVLWGIHHSTLDPEVDSRNLILIAKASTYLSSWVPKRIVCCSMSSLQAHEDLGYRKERMTVIPNGYDVEALRFQSQAQTEMKRALGLADDQILIGMAARFDPQKAHQILISAAAQFGQAFPGAHFVLCGYGVDSANRTLRQWIENSGRASQFHLLGEIEDMAKFYSALDVATLSSSHGEAFPNVVAEAMLCEVPCVATDVGDVTQIIGDTGIVVPAGDPGALSAAWGSMIESGAEERRSRGARARQRIADRYEISRVAAEFEEMYVELADVEQRAV